SMPTPCPSSAASAPGRSMYRRNNAPPGEGRYSTPSSSRPSDATVGDRSPAMSVDLSATLPPSCPGPLPAVPGAKNEKGPDGAPCPMLLDPVPACLDAHRASPTPAIE